MRSLRSPKSYKILVVEDDVKTAGAIDLYLKHGGFETLLARDGLSALEQARERGPDLIILDLMLPQINGLDVCRILRSECDTPIIMLTARTTEDDKLRGLDLGADDYVTKPFSPRELVARVRAVLRRTAEKSDSDKHSDTTSQVQFNDLIIDLRRHEASLSGKLMPLTPTEFKLLETFVRSPERTFTRQELVERVFGWDYEGLERTVDAHIMNLRKKLNPDRKRPSFISTVFGIGYKFSGERHDP